MNTMPIQIAAQSYTRLRERLKADYPDIDDDTLGDTLEGISELPEQLSAVVRSVLDDEMLAEALKLRIADMRARLGRLETRAGQKRELVGTVMRETGIPRLVDPEFTASVRPVPKGLVVSDETLIPDQYWVPQPPKLNRQDLLAVPGAVLSNGGSTLSVRSR
jgi:hypothetical protein